LNNRGEKETGLIPFSILEIKPALLNENMADPILPE